MWSLIYWHRHLPRCIKQGPQNNLYASSSWTQPIHTYSGSCRHPHTCLACLSLALLEHCHLICSVIHHLSPRPFFSHSATDSCLPNRSAPRIVFLQYKYQKVTLYKLLMTSCFLKDKFGALFMVFSWLQATCHILAIFPCRVIFSPVLLLPQPQQNIHSSKPFPCA